MLVMFVELNRISSFVCDFVYFQHSPQILSFESQVIDYKSTIRKYMHSLNNDRSILIQNLSKHTI